MKTYKRINKMKIKLAVIKSTEHKIQKILAANCIEKWHIKCLEFVVLVIFSVFQNGTFFSSKAKDSQ